MTILCPGLLNTDIWDAARLTGKFGGPKHGPVNLRPMETGLEARNHVAAYCRQAGRSGRLFGLSAASDRRGDIEARMQAWQDAIVVLDEKDGF